jgi:hypothetical protein
MSRACVRPCWSVLTLNPLSLRPKSSNLIRQPSALMNPEDSTLKTQPLILTPKPSKPKPKTSRP